MMIFNFFFLNKENGRKNYNFLFLRMCFKNYEKFRRWFVYFLYYSKFRRNISIKKGFYINEKIDRYVFFCFWDVFLLFTLVDY